MEDIPVFTYIGGPTVIFEWAGLRFITDPTFDPAGGEYPSGPAVLKKLAGPAASEDDIGAIDVVLLSHDHHFDNLDRRGRTFLSHAQRVFTTPAGAERLGANAIGLENWQAIELAVAEGELTITGTPCRHGPAGMDRGPVTGFVVAWSKMPDKAIYVSGDTVWYEGVAEVSRRFQISHAVLFMGAAVVPEVTKSPLTMTVADGVEAARAFSRAQVIPVHYEGWAHFSESRDVISRAFNNAGLGQRIVWLAPTVRSTLQTKTGV